MKVVVVMVVMVVTVVVVVMPTDGRERASKRCLCLSPHGRDGKILSLGGYPCSASYVPSTSYEPSLWALGGERFPPCIGWFCGHKQYV